MEISDIFARQKGVINDSLLEEIADIITDEAAQSGIFPNNLRELFREAERCLALSCDCGKTPLHWFDVTEIGCPADLTTTERKEYFSRINAMLASAFAGTSRAFAVRWSSWETPSFSVGLSEGGINLADAVLRSSCMQAAVRDSHAIETPSSTHRAEASCRITFMDINTGEQKFPREESVYWPDNIAAALPGKKYSAEIRFERPNESLMLELLSDINKITDELSAFRETSMQVSGNVGNGYSTTGAIQQEVIRGIAGAVRDTPSYGMSASFSRIICRTDAEYIIDRLKFCAARVNQMLRCGAHAVSLSVAAEDESDIQVIEAVLSGALASSGINIKWCRNSQAILMPDHALSLMFSVPSRDCPGFVIHELEDYSINIPSEEAALDFGSIVWNGQLLHELLSIPLKELNRHVFVCGMTGSGKTNSVCHLLTKTDVPFLVIEPVKGEYRSLCSSAKQNTEVYTMDISTDEICPVNPLWFPVGGSLQYHIDSIKTIIASAFDLYAAMPNILEQCLIKTYTRSGWNIVTGRNVFEGKLPDDKLYPVLSDLCTEIEDYLNTSGFQGETKGNYKGALLSRLQSFTSGAKGMLLNQQAHIDFDRIIRSKINIILELDAMADDADKSIVMGTVLAQYFQCLKLQQRRIQGGLKHITVLEEAHHLFAESLQESNGSDARRKLSESLSNMLAEIRAYGEGIIIVDQSPSRISPEVIKNTAVKIIHRVDYGKDIDLLRDALLLRGNDTTTTRLLTGHAIVRFGGMNKPAVVAVPLSMNKETFSHAKSEGPAHKTLLQSSADIIMGNTSFAAGLIDSCRLFVNQVFFDGLCGIQSSLPIFFRQIEKLIYLHGYSELSRAIGGRELTTKLAILGIRALLRKDYSAQKYFCGSAEMFIERIIAISGGIRDKEWELLNDYRNKRLHCGLAEFYSNSDDAVCSRLRAVCGNSRYLGLAVWILPAFEKILADGTAAGEAVKKCLAGCFYVMPEKTVVDVVCLLLSQYTGEYNNV